MKVLALSALLVLCVAPALAQDAPGTTTVQATPEEWKAVETPVQDATRRRRVRKRKRRPERLDEVLEPWQEMAEPSPKTYTRRRTAPNFEKIRDPFTALQEADAKQRKLNDIPDLKTLLKQNGGFSLSEVLQQKNLTLSEVLKGNPNALSLLAQTEAPPAPKTRRPLPVTSAKLRPKPPLEIPPEAAVITVNEILGLNAFRREDEPLKMVINLDEAPKLPPMTAKDEIQEVLQNPTEREFLTKLLLEKNMTVDELIQLRERGSSHVHLADIFHNNTKEPEPAGEVIGAAARAPKNLIYPTITTSSTTPRAIDSTPKSLFTITSFPTYKIETNKEVFVPVWPQFGLFQTQKPTRDYADEADYPEVVHPEPNFYEDEFLRLPTGVKSAILASLAIVGLSLLVFFTILMIFKWSQKKKRLHYPNSFKIKSPILQSEQRKSFKTFVSETLGRKKNYYKSHLQSMSDSIWDNDKKPYMI